MKRSFITFVLIGVLTMSIFLCSCGNQSKNKRQGTADNDVLSLREISKDKMMLTMRMADGMNFEAMEKAIESKFSDVDIVIRSNTSLEPSIIHNDTEDIVLMINGNYNVNDLEKCFIDLSSEAFVQNYYISSLQQSEYDGKLFYLPGPSNIYGIVYNKDMFFEHGWTVPNNLDSFISLCEEIESEGIRAIQPSLYYNDATRQFFTGFVYQAVLAGGTNAKWLSDYKIGNATMKNHMEPAFEIMNRLIQAGILRSSDFDVTPGDRSDMMYNNQSCAMILETQAAPSYAEKRAGDEAPELGMMPFYSGSDDNSDYFLSVPIYYMAASKRLEKSGNEKKLAMVKKIFSYLSTVEGQESIVDDNTSVISSVKGVDYQNNAFLDSAKSTIEKGHVVPQPFFVGSAGTEVDKALRKNLKLYTAGNINSEQFMTDLDYIRDAVVQNTKLNQTVTVGRAEEDFTIMETSILIARIFQEKTGAQIGLCPANTRMPGNNWKIYKGNIEYGGGETIDRLLEISFPQKIDVNNIDCKLIKVKMTGENIIRSLESYYAKRVNFSDGYMTAYGLQIIFAPWAGEGNRYVSVKLSNGSELNPSELYTVALWNGSVDPALFSSVEEEYTDKVADLLKEWIESQGGIIAPDHQYFKLDWSIIEKKED